MTLEMSLIPKNVTIKMNVFVGLQVCESAHFLKISILASIII